MPHPGDAGDRPVRREPGTSAPDRAEVASADADHPAGGTGARRRNPRGQGQRLRTQLVDAATGLLADLPSPEVLTLRMVARAVGVAAASVYSHFPDLDGLIEQVIHDRYQDLARHLALGSAQTPTPLARLAGLCWAYVDWAARHPGHYRVIFGGRTPPDLRASSASGAGAAMLADLRDALHDASGPASGAPGSPHAAILLWAGMHGLVTLTNDKHGLAWPPMPDLLAPLLVVHTGRRLSEVRDAIGAAQARIPAAPSWTSTSAVVDPERVSDGR